MQYTHTGILCVQSVDHDLDALAEVVDGFLTGVDLSEVHVLTVTLVWAQFHCLQKHLHCSQGANQTKYNGKFIQFQFD